MPPLIPNSLPLNIMKLISLKIISLNCFCSWGLENKRPKFHSQNLQQCDLTWPEPSMVTSHGQNLQQCDLTLSQVPCCACPVADLLSQDPGSPRKGHRTQESPRNGRGGEAGTTHFEDRKAHKLGWPLDAIGKKKLLSFWSLQRE